MEYTILKLAKLTSITTRTLRYYDKIGLLKPKRINSSNYRIYGEEEVDKLQLILFYKELGVELDTIKNIVNSPSFNKMDSLKEHHEKLLNKKKLLEMLIYNVENTISSIEGGDKMKDSEKFKGFKEKLIEENEAKYGKEIRKKYGEDVVNYSNNNIKNMKEEDFKDLEKLSLEVNKEIKIAFEKGDPGSEIAQRACDLHKKWLMNYWKEYSKEAHMALAQMYVDDERFTAYYDNIAKGAATFLRDAMSLYTK